MTFVSIIIPTFNKAPLLCDILKDLNNQSFKDFEVIVVDDESSDNTIEMLKEISISYPLRVFKTGLINKFGMCKAFNIGISQAEGELCLLVNDDIYLHPTCMEHHVIAQKRTRMRHAFIGPRFKCPPFEFGIKVTSKEIRRREFRRYTAGGGFKGYPLYREKMMVSSNLSIGTQKIRKLGGYNEKFDVYTGEIDREIHKRISRRMQVLYLWRAQAFSVRYWHQFYAQTKWVTDNDTRDNLDMVEWKNQQTAKVKREHILQEALDNPPKELMVGCESPIIDRR